MANWLEARASVSSPVSGDFATTANFALVVSGVPTSEEKTKASGASGASGIDPGGRQPVQQPRAEAHPAQVGPQHPLVQLVGSAARLPAGDVHEERLSEKSTRRHIPTLRPHPPASADRKATVSPATSGNASSRVTWSPLSAATT